MRLIDADNLIEQLKDVQVNTPGELAVKSFIYAVLATDSVTPTIEATPIRHGHWIDNDDIDFPCYTCSACHCEWVCYDGTPEDNNMRYCPECGAKMDEPTEHKEDWSVDDD